MNSHPIGTLVATVCLLLACAGSSSGSCASRELHEAELAMRTAYREVLRSLPDREERRRFMAAQKVWREKRDVTVAMINRHRPCEKDWLEFKVELTRERAACLRRMLASRNSVKSETLHPAHCKLVTGNSILHTPAITTLIRQLMTLA